MTELRSAAVVRAGRRRRTNGEDNWIFMVRRSGFYRRKERLRDFGRSKLQKILRLGNGLVERA